MFIPVCVTLFMFSLVPPPHVLEYVVMSLTSVDTKRRGLRTSLYPQKLCVC